MIGRLAVTREEATALLKFLTFGPVFPEDVEIRDLLKMRLVRLLNGPTPGLERGTLYAAIDAQCAYCRYRNEIRKDVTEHSSPTASWQTVQFYHRSSMERGNFFVPCAATPIRRQFSIEDYE